MSLSGGIILARPYAMVRTLFLLALSLGFLATTVLGQTIIRDEYWGGGGGRIAKDSLGPASEISQMEVVVENDIVTVTITGPFFYNYAHHIKGAHKTPPGDLYISSSGWKVKGTPPYTQDTFSKDGGWDYVVSLFDKAVYKLDWSKIEWTRPKPGSVIYRRDQAWRGGYGEFVSWADIKLTDKALVISFPLDSLIPEALPVENVSDTDVEGEGEETGEDGFGSANMLDMGLHWTMMCGNDVIQGAFAVPVEIYSDYEVEGEEIPIPRPTLWAPPPDPQLVPWGRDFRWGTFIPLAFHRGDDHDYHNYHDGGGKVPEPSSLLLLLGGLSAVGFLVKSRRGK